MKVIGSYKKILLVDDDEITNELHKLVIQKMGEEDHIFAVRDGKEALDYLRKKGEFSDLTDEHIPDIIFLDINMAGMNGFEFMDEFHKLPFDLKNRIRIVMLTTSIVDSDRAKAMTYTEVADFQIKPLTCESLQEVYNHLF